MFELSLMEKGTTRKILFDKKSSTTTESEKPKAEKRDKKTVQKSAPPPEPPKKSVIEWLKSHDLIKIRPLCEKASIDPGTFHRWLHVTKKIPDEAIEKLTPILKEYGFETGV